MALFSLPAAAAFSAFPQQTIQDVESRLSTEISADGGNQDKAGDDASHGLITDLAWILLLGTIVSLLFKKLKQPVVLGYILAGFFASPHFEYLPSISNLENISFWAELGIVVLMFTLGLEFSFRKLMNSGSTAAVTALVIITGMTFAGFGVGRLLDLNSINSIFLGGMISMSSTTIILKAFTDLGIKQKKFASLVLAVLIIEDLFAVLMLVLLSSLAVGNVEGGELLWSVAKLVFFLIIWFLVGVYVIPTVLEKCRAYLNNESALILAMALCFSMAVFSVMCGFSLELGAFVMGSVLAGTIFAERFERVVQPVKDLFGSVFFISVGMMVDPVIIATYWKEILLLAVVVIAGMIIFGTLGMLLTGQTLKVAIESGFSLTQIGEFSFIIASLGMSLGVLEASLYPIIVAVSVITIFTTPYFIKLSGPAYAFIERHLPQGLQFLIDRYSAEAEQENAPRALWKTMLTGSAWRIVLYSVVLTGIILISKNFLFPLLSHYFGIWSRHISAVITLGAMLPFLFALAMGSTGPEKRMRAQNPGNIYLVPLVAVRVVRCVLALLFTVYFITLAYNVTTGWIAGLILMVVIMAFASTRIKIHYDRIEKKFIDNLNSRENTRLGRNNNLIGDIHQAYIEVGPYCSFVGDRLKDSGLRSDYGVSISSIQRGQRLMTLPGKNARIFPGDILGVIGTDDQIKRLNDDIEAERVAYERLPVVQQDVELKPILLSESSPLAGKRLAEIPLLKQYYSMIVNIYHADGTFSYPEADSVLRPGDTVWVVGDPSQFDKMK